MHHELQHTIIEECRTLVIISQHQILAEKGSSKVQAVTDIQTRTIFREETICTRMSYHMVCNENETLPKEVGMLFIPHR